MRRDTAHSALANPGSIDVSLMEDLLDGLLAEQLIGVHKRATGAL
jgi:hypothetical protein